MERNKRLVEKRVAHLYWFPVHKGNNSNKMAKELPKNRDISEQDVAMDLRLHSEE